MKSTETIKAANSDDCPSPEAALVTLKAYRQAREKDPLSIHIMWKDDFLASLPRMTDEELAANPPHPF